MTGDSSTQIEAVAVALTVNGVLHERRVAPRMLFSDFLRDELRLTGTHVGCEHGVCGACTVIVDGAAVRSCLMLAVQANGAEVTTLEGLVDDNGELGPIQQAFAKHYALQCGFCTSGFVMTIAAELEEGMSEAEVRELLSGNLCRCTGYQTILDAAVELAAPSDR